MRLGELPVPIAGLPEELAGLRIAKERGMEAPDPQTAVASSNGAPDDREAATEATKDQPAPAPSANIPAEPNEPETDPDATDSKT